MGPSDYVVMYNQVIANLAAPAEKYNMQEELAWAKQRREYWKSQVPHEPQTEECDWAQVADEWKTDADR